MEVAWPDFGPGIGNADNRLAQIFVGEAHRFEHGARRRTAWSVSNRSAVPFWFAHLKARSLRLKCLRPSSASMMASNLCFCCWPSSRAYAAKHDCMQANACYDSGDHHIACAQVQFWGCVHRKSPPASMPETINTPYTNVNNISSFVI